MIYRLILYFFAKSIVSLGPSKCKDLIVIFEKSLFFHDLVCGYEQFIKILGVPYFLIILFSDVSELLRLFTLKLQNLIFAFLIDCNFLLFFMFFYELGQYQHSSDMLEIFDFLLFPLPQI